ncbi:ABC transporter transmembrane region 2-domain-containing protein [Hyaloraphidium curvatum]|nr:ABC transporter transmembrane region 2-domain-containing protein [Hyaloraphidium curvatum]
MSWIPPAVVDTVKSNAASATAAAAAAGTAFLGPRNQRTRRILLLSAFAAAGAYYLQQQRRGFPKQKDLTVDVPKKGAGSDRKRDRGKVDAEFVRQIKVILSICIPGWHSPEAMVLYTHTFFLVLRTYLSLVVADLDGRIVKDLIRADLREFVKGIIYWFAIAIPATYTNSMIRYLQSKIAIAFRTKLTRYVTDLYVDNNTYYKIIQLDRRIEGADQLITTDVNRFCNAASALYSNLGKPLLDMIIFNVQLARNVGAAGTVALFANYLLTAAIMRAATPSFGKMAAEEAELEGDFRYAHTRIITNAEEIAFYNGGELELSVLDRAYRKLIRHVNKVYQIRIAYNMFEDFVIKYLWSAFGLMISAVPVFYPEWAGSRTKREVSEDAAAAGLDAAKAVERSTGQRTAGFITNKRLMISLADAGGRLMYSYKDLSELAGYTSRVYTLIEALQDLHKDKFMKLKSAAAKFDGEEFDIADQKGVVFENGKSIRFEGVPVAVPAGDSLLVKDLTFEIQPGDHLIVTGPNGSGKTSVMRILARLWPLFRGELEKPPKGYDSIFYIPQRPYLVVGSLRDQVIYPHSHAEMKKAGRTDEELEEILGKVYLQYLVDREGGWDAVKEWKDVFSGGEKQRIQMARLFYHSPKWAVLDEATSAVSPDVEGLMYAHAADAGITFISISHRPALFKYHAYLLRLGEGEDGHGWSFERISSPEEIMHSLEGEIQKLEAQLADVDDLKRRLAAINMELRLNMSAPKDGALRHARRSLV